MTKLNPQQLESLVKEFFTEHFDIPNETMTAQTTVRELGIDSIMMLGILLDMEDKLAIKLTDLSMPAHPKISDVVAMIERNLAAGAAA